jgi:hypothetical protein
MTYDFVAATDGVNITTIHPERKAGCDSRHKVMNSWPAAAAPRPREINT